MSLLSEIILERGSVNSFDAILDSWSWRVAPCRSDLFITSDHSLEAPIGAYGEESPAGPRYSILNRRLTCFEVLGKWGKWPYDFCSENRGC